jgi:predicted adenylyl cyclase CyaB
MATNIEIKARVPDLAALQARAAALADHGPTPIAQDDTFFTCPNGRLKLRVLSPHDAQLIFYRRPDAEGPKASHYVIARTDTPDAMREALGAAYGACGRVRKQRTLYRAGRTRIHLDEVEGLGSYLELEVVLAPGDDEAGGVAEAQALLDALGIEPDRLVRGAYVDLLAQAAQPGSPGRSDSGASGANGRRSNPR